MIVISKGQWFRRVDGVLFVVAILSVVSARSGSAESQRRERGCADEVRRVAETLDALREENGVNADNLKVTIETEVTHLRRRVMRKISEIEERHDRNGEQHGDLRRQHGELAQHYQVELAEVKVLLEEQQNTMLEQILEKYDQLSARVDNYNNDIAGLRDAVVADVGEKYTEFGHRMERNMEEMTARTNAMFEELKAMMVDARQQATPGSLHLTETSQQQEGRSRVDHSIEELLHIENLF